MSTFAYPRRLVRTITNETGGLSEGKMTEAAVRRGRKAKFSDSEVRDRMIQHATDDVLEHGVTYGLDSVRLDRLHVLAEVPRNAAYSVFSDSSTGRTPQENLRREVVLSLLRGTPGGNASAHSTKGYPIT